MTSLLTARAVADMLDVSAETILRWTRRGELPAIRLPGGALRYRSGVLEEWLSVREIERPANDLEPAGNRLEGKAACDGTHLES
jgi:excisionase family DNA binding protein